MMTAFVLSSLANDKVLVFDMAEEISSSAWIHTQEALDKAKSENADMVLIHMNTYGGELVFADSIRQAILADERPIFVFINRNAASAGALIATACDSIFMSPGSSIGAATVVSGADGSKAPDKYQSYMRAIMRATAEAHPYNDGKDSSRLFLRDPRIAEAFVDEAVSIEGVIDSAHVLTLTTQEAIRLGYCEGEYPNEETVIAHVAPNAQIVRYEPSLLSDIKGGLLSTGFRGILILIIIGGIYFELQTPGVGFPILASAVAAVLYFAPLYIDGLAENWEIVLFILGLILLALEVFVFPGFGVSGIAGIVCVVASLTLSLLDNDGFSFEGVESMSVMKALAMVLLSIVLGIICSILLGKYFFKNRSTGPLAGVVLATSQDVDEGFVGVDKVKVDAMIGRQGIALTDLRPGGKVEIDGDSYDAISSCNFISRGHNVVVLKSSSGQVVVKEV